VQQYQLGDHLGSAILELDEAGGLISYEEYLPYGSTAYQAGPSAAEVRLKRYRYIGNERDFENGFSYCFARYQCPWLGRWISPDPKGIAAGLNLYGYADQSPVVLHDPNGRDPVEPKKEDKPASDDDKKKAPDGGEKKRTLQEEVDDLKEPEVKDEKAKEPAEVTSYLFTSTQQADEEANRTVFEAMITRAVGKDGLAATQVSGIARKVWDKQAAGFTVSVQTDAQSTSVSSVSIGLIYHAWAENEGHAAWEWNEPNSPVKVGLYVLPVATYADTGGKKSWSFGASAVGAASVKPSERTSLDLNATVTGATSTQLTDNTTTLSPYGAFGVGAALTFKPGKGVQIPVEGSVTWASGPQSGATSTTPTQSTRFNAGVGVGKLDLFGLPFVGVYVGVAHEAIHPPFTAPSSAQKVTTGTIGIGVVF
jgi:RHS repeat-associated protein